MKIVAMATRHNSCKMSDENKQLYDSTPERKIRTPKISDRSIKPKTTAWNEDETELLSVARKHEHTETETTFITDISPVHSSPGRSDKELLQKPNVAAQSPLVLSPERLKNSSEKNIQKIESGKQSEISSLRSVTPISESRSYRDRIKERVAAAKERALAASAKPRSRRPSKPKGEDVDKEDEEVEEAMRRHKAFRVKWKAVSTSVQVGNLHLGYDMFSKTWEESTSPVLREEETSNKGEESEDEKLLTAEVLGSREGDWLPLFQYEMPKLTNFEELKQKQIGILFCPSNSPVPIEEKLEPNAVPRFVEEEGLYVGKPVKLPWKRVNKIEQRIMAMGSEKFWFGEDGELKGTRDPLTYIKYRECKEDVIDNSLIEYKPAIIENKNVNILDDGPYVLEIDVGRVNFDHHPLFSKEDVLASKLKLLISAIGSNRAERLGHKLTSLRLQGKNDKNSLKDIKEARTQWLDEKRKERELITTILVTWRDIKTLRESQQYASTNIRLIILSRDQLPHEMEWDIQLKKYLDELEEEAEEEFAIKMEKYEAKLEEYNQSCESKSLESLEKPEEPPPEKPKRESRQKLKNMIIEELSKSLRPPNEPVVELELAFDVKVDASVSDKLEEERKLMLNKCQLWVVLRHNDKEVDRVKALQEANFQFLVSHRFCLRLTQWPKSLGLGLLELGQPNLFGRKPTAEIFIPIPNRVNTDGADWQEFEFSCGYTTGELSHAGVGTSLRHLTSGLVSIRTGWAEPLPNIFHHIKQKEPKKKNDIAKLKEWVEQVHLDPNDPTNADLLESIKSHENKEVISKSAELCSGLSGLELCSEEELSGNLRLKLLLLRQSGQPEFRTMRRIPLNDREIPKDIFKIYDKRIGNKEKKKAKGYNLDEVRAQGKEFLDNLRDEMTKVWRLEQSRSFRDLVHEEPVPDLWTLGLTFMRWLQPKRPLRPRRKGKKKLPVKSLVGQQLEILVNIGRAFEVPVRKDEDKPDEAFQIAAVRPFVEVTFQDQRRRTPTGEGPNPTWNQDLHLPIHCPGGVQSVRDCLHFHLYDETLVDLVEDDRLRETNVHQRMGRYWLGSLRIPFSALYQSSRIEGTFQLYSPPVLLGYNRESREFRDSTFLSIFVMVHPPLHPPTHIQEKLESKEDNQLVLHLDQWITELTKTFPNRRMPTIVPDTTGKGVCITRFLRPIEPPEIIVGEKTTSEIAARFVSMIPVSLSPELNVCQTDIWMTANQILEYCVTPAFAQAALLGCFLMKTSGAPVRLLVGTGVPGGSCVYVLTCSEKEYTVWDPSTGRKYPSGDPFCPLSRVYGMIDDTNIWFNYQKEDLLTQVNLDISKRYNWWPAFGRSFSPPNESVQPESLTYGQTCEVEVKRLQEKLEKLLRNAIVKLRQTNRTIWNRYVQSSLRKLLPGLEKAAWNGTLGSPPDHIHELQHIISSYKMCGFPINMGYTTPTALVEAVKSTGVHLNDAPEIEFSVAVYIHPFPSNVLSVWVYVASLIRRR